MARLYRHKNRGYQIRYIVYFPDGTQEQKYRYYSSKAKAITDYPDIEVLETHSLKDTLTASELRFALRKGFISREEARALGGPDTPLILPHWDELKKAFLARSAENVRDYMHYFNTRRAENLTNYFGTKPVNEITEATVQKYMRERLKTVKGKTVRADLLTLSQILDIAVEQNALPSNPARTVDSRMLRRDTRERKPRSLTKEEISVLVKTAREDTAHFGGEAYPIIMTYLYTGMRRGELVYLKTGDVDLGKRAITVQPSAADKFSTKSGKFRIIGINRNLTDILRLFVERKTKYLFGTKNEPLLLPNGHSVAFLALRKKAKLPNDITLHSLRHTYITHLLDAGVPIRRVQYLAGHADIKTTMKYAHLLPSDEIAEDRLSF